MLSVSDETGGIRRFTHVDFVTGYKERDKYTGKGDHHRHGDVLYLVRHCGNGLARNGKSRIEDSEGNDYSDTILDAPLFRGATRILNGELDTYPDQKRDRYIRTGMPGVREKGQTSGENRPREFQYNQEHVYAYRDQSRALFTFHILLR